MSDSPEEFAKKTDDMIALALAQLDRVGKIFTSKMVFQVVRNTPGPNNQLPETEYYATGRLRGAWVLADEPISSAGRWEGGPYDEDGFGETKHAELDGEIMAGEMKPLVFLNNDVAYNYIVNFGGGRMPVIRDYVATAAKEDVQFVALAEAMTEAMAA